MLRSVTPPTIPHMALRASLYFRSGLGRLLAWPLPLLESHLARSAQGQLVGRCVLGDGRAGADRGAIADLHWCHQHCARADECAVADLGAPLIGAVIVAGDRPGADVDLAADRGIADVAQVVHLAAGTDLAVLDLDEITQVHAIGDAHRRTDRKS